MDFDDSYSAITEAYIDLDIDIEDIDPGISNFTEQEIKDIVKVIEGDKSLRREERARKRRIEESIDGQIIEIQMKNIDDGVKFCSNCGEKFMMIINPRQVCNKCNKGICNNCTHSTNDGKICKLCNLDICKELNSGKWLNVTSKENGRFRRNPSAVILNSLRKYTKNKAQAPTIPNGSINSSKSSNSNAGIRSPIYNSKNDLLQKENSLKVNGSIQSPIYIRKTDSPISMKTEIEKPVHEIAVDVVDMGDSEPHVMNNVNTLESKSKHHLGSNLNHLKPLSASSASIYSETQESYQTGLIVSGEILFSVHYNDSNKTLNIFVDQCKNLAIADRHKRQTNPYIKTYLLPDKTKSSKKKSSYKKSNVNPTFKETLTYYVSKESLSSRTLSVAVWHQRTMSYNYFLGEVHLLLADTNLTENVLTWYPLQEKMKYPNRSGGHIYKGELIIKLRYKQSSRKDGKGSLHVFIKEAQQLESGTESINAYVRGYLLPDRSSKTKKKTPVQKGKINIQWNSLLQFTDVTLEELKDRSLELSVYHYHKFKSNEFLGGVRLNHGLGLHHTDHVSWMDAQGTEKTTWENFLSNPNEETEAILNLRPNLEY